MSEIKFKYRIDELMNMLSVSQYRQVMKIIPQQLNVSSKTFFNYRNIKLTDQQDIPYEKVAILEKLFSLKAGELQNYTVNAEPIDS